MKNIFLKTFFYTVQSPSERLGHMGINFGIYFLALIALGLGAVPGANRLDEIQIFIPLAGIGFLVLHSSATLAFKKDPWEYLARLFWVSRNGILFPALLLPFVLTFPTEKIFVEVMAGLIAFTYVFVAIGHIIALIKTKSSMVWYLVFVVNRLIAMIGGAYLLGALLDIG